MRRSVSIFGSTGSVGRNTADLLVERGGADAFDVVALSGAGNIALLAEQARALGARIAVTADEGALPLLREALAGSGVAAMAGSAALADAASEPADWTMSAIVGAAGLTVSLRAARNGGVLALANKESLVCAGELLRRVCAAHGTTLLPVDSEHSAIFQALRGEREVDIDRIILTASGGPFRDWPLARMAQATPAQARAHPNWDMGERISIDSATMFNKGMELIETHKLFPVEPHQIDAVVHPQSIVHSMVEFRDGSIIAHLGVSDMRGPIGFALDWPARGPRATDRLDLTAVGRLDFETVDETRFPAVRLARETMETGGLAGAIFNAAKESALDGFIQGGIGFLDMATLVEHVLWELRSETGGALGDYDIEDVLALDRTARARASAWIERRSDR